MVNKDIESFIREEFKTGIVREKLFPMMTKFGVRDYSETVHSLGLNYITAIGREFNEVVSLSEYPVYPHVAIKGYNEFKIAENNEVYGVSKANIISQVRPDSVWFDKFENTPVLICEFERYENNRRKDKMLKEKIQNLLVAYHQLGSNVPYILFVYWSYSGIAAEGISEYISILDDGFKTSDGKNVAGINSRRTKYLVYHAIAKGNKENLTINQWVSIR
ncbi:hypothetical protein BD780_003479 [Clostridium tetanomorphum]|nr:MULTISPECIES: hypothetical protein [Clostridia]KAJ51233.1 hypothetical protein CTM_13973 [Clostridium tetanomorphum DSM 665]MBP1863678.1 hypothetical protein [Clostridium tetanomorphum]NRS86254.1 hypothetical protein [Clostridium tetanomorphum]